MTNSAGIPSWQKNVMERVGRPDKPNRHGRWGTAMNTLVSKEFREVIAVACQLRNISRSGYIRRAVSKQIAQDLGLEVHQVLKLTPKPTPWGVRTAPVQGDNGFKSYAHAPDNGEGFGDWGWDEVRP